MAHTRSSSSGVFVSLAASLAFGTIYFLTPYLAPLGGLQVWGIRLLVTAPIIWLILRLSRQMSLFTDIAKRFAQRPLLVLGVLACGLLVSLQLWLFSWAPLNGRGLEVALGYFLLPLVLVIVGRFLYRDSLSWWHWLATAVAAAGVSFEIVRVGGFSWETLAVCLGYPLYFVLRRSLGTANTGGLLWELLLVMPVGVWIVAEELARGEAFRENPWLWITAPLVSALAAVALWLYILASKLLSISLFGLLSYVEPALLVVAAMLIGERIAPGEFITYGAIWSAVLILLVGGVVEMLRNRR
ncbi:EamA family transporter RarD [Leucobacter sp. UCMA 4100]|uniref:EamA family transporter RarD n=1 Tax=Leucobacter sp. UCMA 4100 TaxID=2810534 RepID=UPI0022EAE47F|nr:EamA family transporter RarD [Leucobacter sp. UCMA 4100]MDA3147725.1 EamA family transporter RarD [Leucobacter sp. UCMA 4100]